MDNLIATTDASLLAYILPNVSTNAYYEGYGWFGELTIIDPTEMYKFKKTDVRLASWFPLQTRTGAR